MLHTMHVIILFQPTYAAYLRFQLINNLFYTPSIQMLSFYTDVTGCWYRRCCFPAC